MATVEEIREGLKKANIEYDKVEAELDRLEKLKRGAIEEDYIGEKKELELEKKDLREEKAFWRQQIQYLQKILFEFEKKELEKKEEKLGEVDDSLRQQVQYLEKRLSEFEEKGKRKAEIEEFQVSKRWRANGAVTAIERKVQYFADPAEWNQSLVNKITQGSFLMIHGVRASGKSSSVYRTMELLNENSCLCLYASFEGLTSDLKLDAFWKFLISRLLKSNKRTAELYNPSQTSWDEFLALFEEWPIPVVLFIDELDNLYWISEEIKDNFLGSLRSLKQQPNRVIHCVITIGTFSILHLNTSNPRASPFNITEPYQNPNLPFKHVKTLFEEFASDRDFDIDPIVINDIYALTNG